MSTYHGEVVGSHVIVDSDPVCLSLQKPEFWTRRSPIDEDIRFGSQA